MAKAARKMMTYGRTNGAKQMFDRRAEDFSNSVLLEHVNVTVPDQGLATTFYITGLGFTRDPYLMPGTNNMWVNIGRSQFHLPMGKPQVLRGRVGLIVPDLKQVAENLKRIRRQMKGTKFSVSAGKGYIDATSPWGNKLRLYSPNKKFGPIVLGMPYVMFDVPVGTADGIARFYNQVMGIDAKVGKFDNAKAARANVGHHQELIFREKRGKLPAYDGHHLQLYVADFSGPHEQLGHNDAVSEESNQFQYRFLDIFDPENGKTLYRIEHEIRSLSHPLYGRPLVNRNPSLSLNAFAPGYDNQSWAQAL